HALCGAHECGVSKEVLQRHTQRSSSLFLFGQVSSEVTLLTINPSYLLLLLALLEVRDICS
ncbi:hypothetical protein MMJ09_27485, partial [Bacillus vallismortis]|nr:hypothetical protein [Bacillus vallismortis]